MKFSGITLSESCYSLNNLMASVGKVPKLEGDFGRPQRLEEAGAGRQRSAAGPVVPKEPDPAVEVAAEAQVREGPGNQASRFPS